jgi:hypothetical protein
MVLVLILISPPPFLDIGVARRAKIPRIPAVAGLFRASRSADLEERNDVWHESD